jgi:hypothetical protein
MPSGQPDDQIGRGDEFIGDLSTPVTGQIESKGGTQGDDVGDRWVSRLEQASGENLYIGASLGNMPTKECSSNRRSTLVCCTNDEDAVHLVNATACLVLPISVC